MKMRVLTILFPCLAMLLAGSGLTPYTAYAASLNPAANQQITSSQTSSFTARDVFDQQTTGGIFSVTSALENGSIPQPDTSGQDPEQSSAAASSGKETIPGQQPKGVADTVVIDDYPVGMADTVEIDDYPVALASAPDDEYSDLAIADVDNYVNVRSLPNTDSPIIGKMYDGSVAEILSREGSGDDIWLQVVSGSVEGYIKAEYFIYGDAAAAVIDDYVTRYAKVEASRLNVRKEPSTESSRIGYLDNGEKVKLLDNGNEWLKIQYTDDTIGFISKQYASIVEEFIHAKSIEEEKAELEAKQKAEEQAKARAKEAESSKPENTSVPVPGGASYTSNEELRSAIIEYAKQFLGNKYVSGGQSLKSGTDCSGFTCYLFAEFGYSLSRTPDGQWKSNGRQISSNEIQPGDIVCYSSNGSKCTHVGLYIGNGQIIHSANKRKGVITSDINYDNTFLGIINVID